ncbi:PREDICTED: uncharacterized protein LOC109116958 [Tarenaya hassleriana]|uniref:uncharacterized protein LOC109116958 n=1 Tax=Tarenaya hassleriana TaxID=28532 RepID=UPI0008FD12C5|nr:PREDICTED: uncharacterized protein LOC109116958 [Tarenaya hassleriana]
MAVARHLQDDFEVPSDKETKSVTEMKETVENPGFVTETKPKSLANVSEERQHVKENAFVVTSNKKEYDAKESEDEKPKENVLEKSKAILVKICKDYTVLPITESPHLGTSAQERMIKINGYEDYMVPDAPNNHTSLIGYPLGGNPGNFVPLYILVYDSCLNDAIARFASEKGVWNLKYFYEHLGKNTCCTNIFAALDYVFDLQVFQTQKENVCREKKTENSIILPTQRPHEMPSPNHGLMDMNRDNKPFRRKKVQYHNIDLTKDKPFERGKARKKVLGIFEARQDQGKYDITYMFTNADLAPFDVGKTV